MTDETICVFIASSPQIFYTSRSHLEFLGSRRVTWSKFHTEDPQFWSELWTSLLSGTFCSLHFNWYTGKTAIIVQKILGTALLNLVTWVTRCPGFVHPWVWHSLSLWGGRKSCSLAQLMDLCCVIIWNLLYSMVYYLPLLVPWWRAHVMMTKTSLHLICGRLHGIHGDDQCSVCNVLAFLTCRSVFESIWLLFVLSFWSCVIPLADEEICVTVFFHRYLFRFSVTDLFAVLDVVFTI
jgi:hypothetical protein